eukprot:3873322-Karenia_brevis.AAC.1
MPWIPPMSGWQHVVEIAEAEEARIVWMGLSTPEPIGSSKPKPPHRWDPPISRKHAHTPPSASRAFLKAVLADHLLQDLDKHAVRP